jgi:hypothetical protein
MEMNNSTKAPILFPFEPDEFWENMRCIIRDEIKKTAKEKPIASGTETPGLIYKPLFKIAEVCSVLMLLGLQFMNGLRMAN